MPPLLSIDEALALVLQHARPLGAELVPIERAAGRFLAEDVHARIDLPPFRSSAMDGFALRAADTPGSLPVVARIPAGRPAAAALRAGEAMGIATGGAVPDGADAVVPIELVEDRGDVVEVPASVDASANVRDKVAIFEAAISCCPPAVASAPPRSARSPLSVWRRFVAAAGRWSRFSAPAASSGGPASSSARARSTNRTLR